MNAPASTILPYIVTREPHTSSRFVVWNQRGKRRLQLATVQEVVDFILDRDPDIIQDPQGNVLDWDEEARRVVRLYGLQPDPEVGRAAMDAFWAELLEQAAVAS